MSRKAKAASTSLSDAAPLPEGAAAPVPVVVPAEPKSEPRSEAKSESKSEPKSESRSGPKRQRRRVGHQIEERIDYHFDDQSLLDCALTHISALKGPRNRAGSYQRLEFLGDHVLGLVISDMLFRTFPKANEGELSRRLADLVRGETCAEIARSIALGDAIRLGASEAQGGGRARTAILADVCEALVGAVFLDGGYPGASHVIERLWGERLRAPMRPLRDPKTVLQEWAQSRALPTPVYREVERTGPHHDPEFRVSVELPALAPAEGRGRSKRAAEQAAAAAMLTREGVQLERIDG